MFSKSEMRERLEKVRESMAENKLDALLVLKPKNVLYLTGLETGRILVTQKKAIFWLKDLYIGIHGKMLDSLAFEIREYERGCMTTYVNRSKIKILGIENLSAKTVKSFSKEFKPRLKIVAILGPIRAVKSKAEISLIEKACSIAVNGMEKAYESIKAGASELDVVAEIERELRRKGSSRQAFDDGLLLASGKHSADIHASPAEKKIQTGESVVVDLGAYYENYRSDMTRTIAVGELSKKHRQVFEFVKLLELETVDLLKVGMTASEVHNLVERKIKKFGHEFYHFTGHGVGLDIHELPSLNPKSDEVLGENMVFTIEPGIYIPKKFGIRFEDTVLLTPKGPKVLTQMKWDV